MKSFKSRVCLVAFAWFFAPSAYSQETGIDPNGALCAAAVANATAPDSDEQKKIEEYFREEYAKYELTLGELSRAHAQYLPAIRQSQTEFLNKLRDFSIKNCQTKAKSFSESVAVPQAMLGNWDEHLDRLKDALDDSKRDSLAISFLENKEKGEKASQNFPGADSRTALVTETSEIWGSDSKDLSGFFPALMNQVEVEKNNAVAAMTLLKQQIAQAAAPVKPFSTVSQASVSNFGLNSGSDFSKTKMVATAASPKPGSKSEVLPAGESKPGSDDDSSQGDDPVLDWDPCVDVKNENVKNVKRDFGAIGNGIADDYSALKKAALYASQNPGTKLLFPPGHYFINRKQTKSFKTQKIDNEHIYYYLNGNKIGGCRAKISVKGDFHRAVALKRGEYHYSDTSQIVPFFFVDSKNFVLQGFELNGNVDKMTRDDPLLEEWGDGVITVNSSDYEIRNMYIHHFSRDGLLLGIGFPTYSFADKNAKVTDVISSNNARQGMSIGQLRGGHFLRCTFQFTGQTGGKYLPHYPQAGVDIEPEFSVNSSPRTESNTGDLVFDQCKFKYNRGGQFWIPDGSIVENVKITNSVIVNSDKPIHKKTVLMGIKGGLIENTKIDLRSGSLMPAYTNIDTSTRRNKVPASFYEEAHTVVNKCTIWSSGTAIDSYYRGKKPIAFTIQNSTITGTHKQSYSRPLVDIENPKANSISNAYYVPSYLANGQKEQIAFRMKDIATSINDKFTASGGPYYALVYGKKVEGISFSKKSVIRLPWHEEILSRPIQSLRHKSSSPNNTAPDAELSDDQETSLVSPGSEKHLPKENLEK